MTGISTPAPEGAVAEATTLGIADRLDIHDLYARQAHAIDGGHAVAWAQTFTSDGVFESPTYQLRAVGRDQLADFAATSNARALQRGDQLRHHLNSIAMVGSGERASVEAYLLIVATSAAGPRLDRSLVVHDELEQVDGQWLLASRRVFRDDPTPT